MIQLNMRAFQVVVELTAEWLHGIFNGLSQPDVKDMRWQGQWFGHPLERMSQEVFDFVYTNRGVEKFLEPLEVGDTWRLTAFNRLQLIAQCATTT